MKSNKLLTIAVLVLVVGCLTPLVSAKTKTDSVKAVGKGTVTNLDTGAEYKAAMVLVAKPELTTSGDVEWSATIMMRFVLPDGTKISAFRGLPFFVEVGDDGVLQGFKIEINGQLIPISTTVIKNKVYGTLQAIIAHESTHVVDFNLRFKVEIEGVDAGH